MKRILALVVLAASSATAQTFEEYHHTVEAPYAGRYEARIGGSSEPSHEKLRLDIGASIDVLSVRDSTNVVERFGATTLSLGADFFTWSRLRSEPNFKFPVEAVDYYFGVNAALRLARSAGHAPLISEVRMRFGHVSAHLVDGDPAFADTSFGGPVVYSREFFDGLVAANGERLARAIGMAGSAIRPYLGVVYVVHTVPELAAKATPYIGLDGYIEPAASLPYIVKAGYELRVNTELEPAIAEHHARLGVKIGRPHSNGVVVETAYFSGRSLYGQSFGREESYLSIGVAVDY
jgi:hypothetical protein